MKRRTAVTLTAALLGLGLFSATFLRADDDDEQKAYKEAQGALLKLVDTMKSKPGQVNGQIDAIKKKFDELKPLMWVYKPRSKHGLGMGPNGSEDIELTIQKIGSPTGKTKLTPQKLAGMKADLIKAAELSKAIAEISDRYAEQYAKKDAKKWKDYNKEMRKGADELIRAVNGGNVGEVKKAAYNLGNSCTSCHSDFRE